MKKILLSLGTMLGLGFGASAQYCTPATTSGCGFGDQITDFSTTGGFTNITNNGSGCSAGNWSIYSGPGFEVSATAGTSFNFTVQSGPTYSQGQKIWVDWNQDGDFSDPGEDVWTSATWTTTPQTGTINIPSTATPGTTTMRVRCSYNSLPTDPCANQSYGEVEDYEVTVIAPLAVDAGITAFYSPTSPACSSTADVWVELFNFGSDTLTSATIEWSQNATMQTAFSWSGSLASGQSDSVNLGPLTVADGDVIQAYTTFPNFVSEAASGAANDTSTLNVGFGLNGTYSIDPSGSGDYVDFTSAVADLMLLGTCGNVIFEVEDGTYNEQVSIGEYPGSGVTGNATFIGANGAASAVNLTFASTLSADNYTLRFDGGDNITFKHIGITAAGTTYGRVVEYQNSSDNNMIDSCALFGSTNNSTSTNICVIYADDGSNHDNNSITNSSIEGGSYAVYFYGNGTASRGQGFVFENNAVQNWYYYGVRTYYVDQVQINNNDLRSSGNYTGTHYGIYAYYADGQNSIANNIVTIQNGYGYGIYGVQWFASAVNRSMVYNNQISLGAQNTSSSSAIYASTINNADFANNSIWIDDNATASEGIYMTNGTGNNIWNNNIHNVGPGYGLYLNGGFNSVDYNNLYVPNGNVGYFGQAYTTLMDWQTASGLDQNSYSVDPMFPSNIMLTTCNDTLDNVAASLAFVMNDLSGNMRSNMPDIGAYEFDGVASFSLGMDTTICSNETIDLGNAASDASWMWNTGDTTNVITVAGSPGGAFIATRVSTCGTAIDTITINTAPNPVAAFDTTGTSYATVVFNNMSTDADTYLWDFGDGNTSTQENPVHIYANGGTYTITLIATGPCGSDTTTFVHTFEILDIEDELGVNLSMYPNPAKEAVTIQATDYTEAQVELFDMTGKLVISQQLKGNQLSISLENLSKGMYLVKVSNESGSNTQRLIKE